jgi:hypothetical protein
MIDGPAVRRLTVHKMALDAIPAGGGFAAGLRFLSSATRITEGAGRARIWVAEAIKAVRAAGDPNPFRDADDETIAAEILRQLDERTKP